MKMLGSISTILIAAGCLLGALAALFQHHYDMVTVMSALAFLAVRSRA